MVRYHDSGMPKRRRSDRNPEGDGARLAREIYVEWGHRPGKIGAVRDALDILERESNQWEIAEFLFQVKSYGVIGYNKYLSLKEKYGLPGTEARERRRHESR